MQRVRLATIDEVEAIKSKADLTDNSVVFALDTYNGTGFAVRRLCTEIDPLISPDAWDLKLRAMFTRDLENMLWSNGGKEYYFNVDAEDKDWQKAVINWGAEQVSKTPELRFKKTL